MEYHPLDIKVEPEDFDSFEDEEYNSPETLEDERLEDLISLPDKDGKIRRPPNAFMLFAREHRRKISSSNPSVPNKKISSILGDKWRNLDPETKSKYHDKAKALDSVHKRQYPDYVYNPKEAREKKKERQMLKRARKSGNQGRYGKEKFNMQMDSNAMDAHFQECSDNNPTAGCHNSSYHKKDLPAASYSTTTSLPTGYILPDGSPKYPIIGAMDDPPVDHSPDVRLHMMQCLSYPNNASIDKNASLPQIISNGRSKAANYMPNEEHSSLGAYASSTSRNIPETYNTAHNSCHGNSPTSHAESILSKTNSSETNLNYATNDALNAERSCFIKQEYKLQDPRIRSSEHQPHCMRLHCSYPSMLYEGGNSCHSSPPAMPHFCSRSYVNPYLVHPYNIPPICPMPYIPMNPAESPRMIPNIFHTPTSAMYHSPSASLYGTGYHTYINQDFLPKGSAVHVHPHSYATAMSHKMVDPLVMVDENHNNQEINTIISPTQLTEEAIKAEADEDDIKEEEIDRPLSASPLNNSSSSLVIVTDNAE